jgi:hypothetical protein
VSLGDSFISGEAGRWAGNTDGDSGLTDALGPAAYFDSPLRDRELIPLCHRSASAMIDIATDAAGGPVNSLNLACSGAQTRTMFPSGAFKPGLDFYDDGPGRQSQATMLQDFAATHDVRMVVVSIGGNDFSFGPIVEACVEAFVLDEGYCSQSSTVLGYVNASTVTTVTGRLVTALQNVRTAMRDAGHADGSWTLVFNLNPDTLATGGDFRYDQGEDRQSTGGCGFYDTDASWASGTLVEVIRNAQIAALARSGVTPAVTLDLGRLVDNRELCTRGTQLVGASEGAPSWQAPDAADLSEWANQIHTELLGPARRAVVRAAGVRGRHPARRHLRPLGSRPDLPGRAPDDPPAVSGRGDQGQAVAGACPSRPANHGSDRRNAADHTSNVWP